MIIQIKVGGVIYDDAYRVFLMTHRDWDGYIVPGGGVIGEETFEDAFKRETREEMRIGLSNIIQVNDKIVRPGKYYKEPGAVFRFIDYFARASRTHVIPNEEILSWGWFNIRDARNLPKPDSICSLLEQYARVFKI